MTNKFVGSITIINPEVDIDTDMIKVMLGSEKGRLELYRTASSTEGEIYVVDNKLERAELLAGMLNAAYEEFMEMESQAVTDDVSDAKDAVNTAFEGESRVPTVESAEDAALANLEKKSLVKGMKQKANNQTKNEKAEITMTNNTNVSTEAKKTQSAAAKQFLALQEGKMQNAKQSPKKGQGNAPKSDKPSVGVKQEEKKEAKKSTPAKSTVAKPNLNTKSEEMTNMKTTANEVKGNRTTAGNTGRKSAGTTTVKLDTKKAQSVGNRLEFQEAANKFSRFQGPWYLNSGLHPIVEKLEELIAMRQLAELGIKDVRFVDPNTVLSYTNHDIKSIVELTLEGKDGKDQTWNVRIKEETREGKTANLNSPNVGWDTVDGELKPVYQVFKKNEENDVTFFGEKGARTTAALYEAAVIDGVVHFTDVDEEGTVHGYTLDKTTREVLSLDSKAYTIQSYVPVIKDEVTAEMLVLALGFAQYAHGYSMHGVVAEA